MEENVMKVNLKIWRQAGPRAKGGFVTYPNVETTPDTSFLETLDILNERLVENGETITVEPWRSAAFPIIKDLMVDRNAFDKIQQAGGYVSFNCGGAQDANDLPISKVNADESMDSASCIGCGACVAACKNGSAMLFVSAKISQLALLPQGEVEKDRRVRAMVKRMDELGFGNCTNTGACAAECPKSIKLYNIGRMNRQFIAAKCKE